MADDDGYDNSFKPPRWWRDKLTSVMDNDIELTHAEVARRAREADGRPDVTWDSSRVTKLFKHNSATIQFVVAISEALKIPPPVFEPKDEKEAEAFERWILANRRRKSGSADVGAKEAKVEQALDASVRSAKGQIEPVPLVGEGSPRDPRTRRAPRGRS